MEHIEQVKQWLQSDHSDIEKGALLMLKSNRNRILYDSVLIKKNVDEIVYELKKISYDDLSKALRIIIMLYKSTLHFDSMLITQLKVSHPKQLIRKIKSGRTCKSICI